LYPTNQSDAQLHCAQSNRPLLVLDTTGSVADNQLIRLLSWWNSDIQDDKGPTNEHAEGLRFLPPSVISSAERWQSKIDDSSIDSSNIYSARLRRMLTRVGIVFVSESVLIDDHVTPLLQGAAIPALPDK